MKKNVRENCFLLCLPWMLPFTFLFPFSPFFFLLWRAKWDKTFPLKLFVSRVLPSLRFHFPLSLPWPSSFCNTLICWGQGWQTGLRESWQTNSFCCCLQVTVTKTWLQTLNIFSRSKYSWHYIPVSHYLEVLRLIYFCGNISNRCFAFRALYCTYVSGVGSFPFLNAWDTKVWEV